MKKLISQINSILWQKTKLTPRDICICTLSGGQDSVLLFIIFLHLKKQWNIKIQLLHFNHFWQEKNFYCSQQVWKLAFIFKNPIYIIISNSFLNNEKIARKWRQQGIERISSIENCEKILTGHTASDRLETSFWHLIRGTSPHGLVSLKSQTNLIVQTEFFNFPKFIGINWFICNCFSENKKKIKILKNLKLSPQTGEKKKFFNYKKVHNRKKIKINTIYFNTCKNEEMDHFIFNQKKFLQYEILLFLFIREFCLLPKKLKTRSYYLQKNIYKKNKKTCSNYFFLIFNYFLFNLFVIPKNKDYSKKLRFLERKEKKQKTKYTFLIFCFSFSKKLLLRPMLVFHRNDITLFSKKYLLPIICDPSNEKLYWSRNRIRHQLFPLLRFFFNPQNEYLINNYLEISCEEQNYLNFLIEKLIQTWLKKQSQVYINDFLESNELIRTQSQKLPKTLQKRLLQKMFQSYKNLQLNFVQIEIIGFISDQS